MGTEVGSGGKSRGSYLGGGGGDPELVLMRGIVEDGFRYVSLSFKSTVELIQFIGQTQVMNGVKVCRFINQNLPEPAPDSSS